MTIIEKEILSEFYFGNITKKEFLKQFPVDLANDENYIYNTFLDCYNRKDKYDLELVLALPPLGGKTIYADKFVELLCLLLKEEWHQQHENIVNCLNIIRSPKSIETLYSTAFAKFDYLDYDDTYSLARKCIHALGNINTEESKEKLRLLAKSEIPIIKEKAEKQLYYYKR